MIHFSHPVFLINVHIQIPTTSYADLALLKTTAATNCQVRQWRSQDLYGWAACKPMRQKKNEEENGRKFQGK